MKTIGYRIALLAALAICGANASAEQGLGGILKPGQLTCDLAVEAARVVTKDPYTFVFKVANTGTQRCGGVVRIPATGEFLDRGLAFPVAQTRECVPGNQAATHFYCKAELDPNATTVVVVTAGAFPRSSGFVCLDAMVSAAGRDLGLDNNVDVACYDPTPPQVCPGDGAYTAAAPR